MLGLLCRHGPKHGYELRRMIESQNIDRIANIEFGSIYGSLRRLAAEGLVEQESRTRAGNRPTRTSYRLTDLGRKELRRLIDDAFVDASQAERPVDLALHFSGLLPKDDVVELLSRRLDSLDHHDAQLDRLEKQSAHPEPGVRQLIHDITDHFRQFNAVERQWTKRVRTRARRGDYRLAREA